MQLVECVGDGQQFVVEFPGTKVYDGNWIGGQTDDDKSE